MNSYSILLLCAFIALGCSQDPSRPIFSETFMSNVTVHFHNPNGTSKVIGWISQSYEKQMFGMTLRIPRGHHQYPMGGLIMELQTQDLHYFVTPNERGEPECECRPDPYISRWWWIPLSNPSEHPPPEAEGLACWTEGEHVNKEVCVKGANMPSIPVDEFVQMMRPSIHYFQYDNYVPDKYNVSLLTELKACAGKSC